MSHVTATYTPADTPAGWLRRSEAWLDSKGKGAWIAAMVLGFIFIWPIGLALLFYMIWGKKMLSGKHCTHRKSHQRAAWHSARAAARPSGNTAFDAYKTETLRRLEEEQDQFEAFLDRLRTAKDKAEFDAFMEDRARRAEEDASTDADAENADKEEA